MPDFKSADTWHLGEVMLVLLFDVRAQFAFADCFQERRQFVGFTGGLKFDAAIRKIAHPACNIEALGDVFHGVAKADALHVAAEEDLLRNHDMSRDSRS